MEYGKKGNTKRINARLQEIKVAPQEELEVGESYILAIGAKVDDNLNIPSTEKTRTVQIIAKINEEEFKWNVAIENENYGKTTPTPTATATPTPTASTVPTPTTETTATPTPTASVEPTPTETPEPTPTEDEEKTYEVSGTAWLDENKDGIMQATERVLDNITAKLVKDNETIKQVKTDHTGKYTFTNIEKGEYQIIYEYEAGKYKVTDYRKTGELEVNSSAISNEEGKALTDVFTVNKDTLNINIGLIITPKFDMSLTKTVSKVIVQNSEGTKAYDYKNNYAKLDINAKYIDGTTILVEYNITVKNEGELEGKVKKIIDYMPKDMTFSTDLNRTWLQDSNGNLVNTELKDISIKPGEEKTITLILRKNVNGENVGVVTNIAEIAETENSENIKDIDSSPANKANGEDDISEANLLIGIRTGTEVLYITLAIVITIMVAVGVHMINKKVLKRD